mgnify:FL=1
MTSVLKEDDKIFTMYRQYKELIHKDAEENDNRVYGTDQLAAQLTVAHMLDHVVCLFNKDEPPKARKVNKTWEEKFDDSAEAEIMQNNFAATSSSANVNVKIKNKKPFITGTATDDGEISWERNRF